MLSHVLSHVVLGPLSDVTHLTLTHPAKAATAATAAMAAAPHNGFDHAAIPNDDDALITYRGQGCPMGQRPL